MSHYRRSNTPGATYFFTVVTYHRQPILCEEPLRKALRNALHTVRRKWPFTIDAWVRLPDHLHCMWTLPPGDADFSTRWAVIKQQTSLACAATYRNVTLLITSKRNHRESTLWQRRFWEHWIRDESDLQRHIDYIHVNPVKHGVCRQVADWPYSTFYRYMARGIYPADWAGGGNEISTTGE